MDSEHPTHARHTLGGLPNSAPSPIGGTLAVAGFGAIFALAGTAVLVFLVPDALRTGTLEQKAGVLVVGILFCGIGLGVIALALHGRAESERERMLRGRYPDTPWMWKPEWARGQIRSGTKATMVAAWCFAAIWNAIAWPIVPGIFKQAAQQPASWIALLFPVVGLGLLGWAGLATARARRFGTGVLSLDTRPGVIGGRFAGVVETGRPLPRGSEVTARVVCVRRTTTGSGKSRSTHESILWEHQATLDASQISLGPTGTRIPVGVQIPFSCSATEERNPNDCVIWRVELHSALPGADYRSQFEVPVFRTAASSAEVGEPEPSRVVTQQGLVASLAAVRVRATPLPRGGMEFYFGPARNLGVALVVTFCAVAFGGGGYAAWVNGAPTFFAVVFGAVALLLLGSAAQLWIGARRVRMEAGELRVQAGFLALGRTRRMRVDDICDFEIRVGMQAGNRAYYRVIARGPVGRLCIATGLPGKPLAQAYVSALRGLR